MTSRNPTDEPSVQGTVMKEANDESSSAIGCEVWMNLGPSMSREHLTDRHKPARGNGDSKSGRTVGAGLQRASHSMPQKFLAIFCRANSAHTPEYPCKVLLRFEAAGHRDVQDTPLGRAQHFLRALYPMTHNKVMRGLAG